MFKPWLFLRSLKRFVFFSIASQTCLLHILHHFNTFNLFAANPLDLKWVEYVSSLTEEHLRIARKLESIKFAVGHWNIDGGTHEIATFAQTYISNLVDFLILVVRSFGPICGYNTGSYLEYTSYTTTFFFFFEFVIYVPLNTTKLK